MSSLRNGIVKNCLFGTYRPPQPRNLSLSATSANPATIRIDNLPHLARKLHASLSGWRLLPLRIKNDHGELKPRSPSLQCRTPGGDLARSRFRCGITTMLGWLNKRKSRDEMRRTPTSCRCRRRSRWQRFPLGLWSCKGRDDQPNDVDQ
jgi:hypothetical protein